MFIKKPLDKALRQAQTSRMSTFDFFAEIDRVTAIYLAGLQAAGIQGARDYVMADMQQPSAITDAYRKRCEAIHQNAVRLQRDKEQRNAS